MRLRPIHFVSDVAAAGRFYEALGLARGAASRSGNWAELAAAGGELGLHDAAAADDGRGRAGFALNFLADEPLEDVERRVIAPRLPPPGTPRHPSWGGPPHVRGPDGAVLQIDEPDRELYT